MTSELPEVPKTIKAIETHYMGYRFRSRLEARWAVWLASLGLEFRYEAEGFDLNGIRYLPDFFVPAWEAWVEVKSMAPIDAAERGEWGTLNEAGRKARALCQASTRPALLILGQPWPGEYGVQLFLAGDDDEHRRQVTEFALCSWCGVLGLVALAPDESHVLWSLPVSPPLPHRTCGHPQWSLPTAGSVERPRNHLEHALLAARQARFEHGERG